MIGPPTVGVDVAAAYVTPALAANAPVNEPIVIGFVNVCVPAHVFEVVVPKAVEIAGVVPPDEIIGYVPVTEVTPLTVHVGQVTAFVPSVYTSGDEKVVVAVWIKE